MNRINLKDFVGKELEIIINKKTEKGIVFSLTENPFSNYQLIRENKKTIEGIWLENSILEKENKFYSASKGISFYHENFLMPWDSKNEKYFDRKKAIDDYKCQKI